MYWKEMIAEEVSSLRKFHQDCSCVEHLLVLLVSLGAVRLFSFGHDGEKNSAEVDINIRVSNVLEI